MTGTPRASTDLSPSAPTTEVSRPAFSVPSRILRTTSGSSPATPPGKSRTVTRPPEAAFHFSPVSLRIRCHVDPSGTRVAMRTTRGAWASAAGAKKSAPRRTRAAFSASGDEGAEPGAGQRSPPPTWGGIGWGVDEQQAINALFFIRLLNKPLLDEQLFRPGEEPARPLLGEHVGQAVVGRTARVQGQRLLEQGLELLPVLLTHARAHREGHVGKGPAPVRDPGRPLEVLSRPLDRSPDRGPPGLVGDEEVVDGPRVPGLVQGQGPA